MKSLVRRLRGLLSLSTVGFIGGAAIGSVWAFVAGLMGHNALNVATFVYAATSVGAVGAVATGAVGLSLMALRRGRGVEELSGVEASAWGAAGGAALLVGGFAIASAVTGIRVSSYVEFAAIGGVIGGLLGGGVVSVAILTSGNGEGAESLPRPQAPSK